LIVSSLIISCSKKLPESLPVTGNAFVDAAFDYARLNLPEDELKNLSAKDYRVIAHHGENRFVQVNYRDGNRSLLLERTTEGFRGIINEFIFNDVNKKSGSLVTEDMITHEGHCVDFIDGKVMRIQPTVNGKINSYAVNLSVINPEVAIVPAKNTDVTIEIFIFIGGGSSGSYGVNLSSLYYMANFDNNYYYSYMQGLSGSSGFNGGSAGGGSAPSTTNTVDIPMIPGATKPIDIAKELGCFSVKPGAVYTLRINVNQPEPNTRAVMNTMADRAVGHTYLSLEQKNPDGSVIKRNVGWYPEDFIKPTDGLQPGVFQDDSKTPYTVSMAVNVNATEFMNAKNYLLSVKQYSLQEANCTNIAINTFAKAGINLPKTKGYVYSPSNNYTTMASGRTVLFSGVNPGDLGEDIRGMNATVFSQNNGGKMVVIEKSPNNTGTKSRVGTCN